MFCFEKAKTMQEIANNIGSVIRFFSNSFYWFLINTYGKLDLRLSSAEENRIKSIFLYF